MPTIPRDVSQPFDPVDPVQLAEFEGFACDVPTDDGMIAAVAPPPLVPTANSVRAARMLRPGFLAGQVALPTPDPVIPTPAATFERRGLHDQSVNVPGLGAVPMWSFEARIQNGLDSTLQSFPAPIIRVREGETVHSTVGTRTGPHTIHHHGIEPTPMNAPMKGASVVSAANAPAIANSEKSAPMNSPTNTYSVPTIFAHESGPILLMTI